jgi:hypothetical protein
MQPALTDDLHSELAQLLDKKYQVWRGERSFTVTSHREFDAVFVSVLLKNPDETFFYPVEGRIDFAAEEMDVQEAAIFLINFIDLYFAEFFEEDEGLYIPIDWSPYQYEAVDFELKGQIVNMQIEKLAEQWLNSPSVH